MKVTVCIGSACHLKGSRLVVEGLKELINDNNLKEKVDLSGTFCMGKCQQEISVMVDDKLFSLMPENVEDFFKKNILREV